MTDASVLIHLTPSARELLAELVSAEPAGTRVRIMVERPGTSFAETGLALCTADEAQPDDLVQDCDDFVLLVDRRSAPYLAEAAIDAAEGELRIRAPHARSRPLPADAPLADRVQHVLDAEIGPRLALHGGTVGLVAVRDGTAVLRFGGGCTGCAQVDVTLKEGVEAVLLERFAGELHAVQDVTDHAAGIQPYYPRR